MFIYFSGTGNSLYMAQQLSEKLGGPIYAIPQLLEDPAKREGCQMDLANLKIKRLGIVFPVYAWAPPELVIKLLESFKIPADTYVYGVALCGENVGNTFERMATVLKARGVHLSAGYSVTTPNNYIVMGKVDVDGKQKCDDLLAQVPIAASRIAQAVSEKRSDFSGVVKGAVPWLTTGVVNGLFNRFGRADKSYYADEGCNGCGLCQKVCPVSNIELVAKNGGDKNGGDKNGGDKNGRDSSVPKWQGHCAMCTACLHTCPQKAIQYGKGTELKGRYFNPYVGVKAIVHR